MKFFTKIAIRFRIKYRLINNRSFRHYFENWYYYNCHNWECISGKFDDCNDFDIEWFTSDPFEYSSDADSSDCGYESDRYISDTGSDYSLYCYNSD